MLVSGRSVRIAGAAVKSAAESLSQGMTAAGALLSAPDFLNTGFEFVKWLREKTPNESPGSLSEDRVSIIEQFADAISIHTSEPNNPGVLAIISDDGTFRDHLSSLVIEFNKNFTGKKLDLKIYDTIQKALSENKRPGPFDPNEPTRFKVKLLVAGGTYHGPIEVNMPHTDIIITSRLTKLTTEITTDEPNPLITVEGDGCRVRVEGINLEHTNDGRSGLNMTPIFYLKKDSVECARRNPICAKSNPIVVLERCQAKNYGGELCIYQGKPLQNHPICIQGECSISTGSSLHNDDAVAAGTAALGSALSAAANLGLLPTVKILATAVAGTAVGPTLVVVGAGYGATAHRYELYDGARNLVNWAMGRGTEVTKI